MSTLAEIQRAVTQLSPADLAKLAQFIQEQEADAWDAQMTADAQAGRLDHLISEADADIDAGRIARLP